MSINSINSKTTKINQFDFLIEWDRNPGINIFRAENRHIGHDLGLALDIQIVMHKRLAKTRNSACTNAIFFGLANQGQFLR